MHIQLQEEDSQKIFYREGGDHCFELVCRILAFLSRGNPEIWTEIAKVFNLDEYTYRAACQVLIYHLGGDPADWKQIDMLVKDCSTYADFWVRAADHFCVVEVTLAPSPIEAN